MTRHLVVAPHLDDGVLSLGGSIHEWVANGDEATVLTLFAKAPEDDGRTTAANLLLTRQLALWGIGHYGDRRHEDVSALAVVGASHVHADLPELLLRNSEARSIADLLATVPEDGLADRVGDVVADAAAGYDVVYLPSGDSAHPDHVLAALAAKRPIDAGIAFYEEIPYCLARPPEYEASWFGGASLDAKLEAARCYRSQLPVLFGGEAAMLAALTGRAGGFGPGHAEGVRHIGRGRRDAARHREGR
ncbi:PIG-L deacetylase family protein [Saccharothrix isguenensis]